MGKARIQYAKPSLFATNQYISIPVSSMDIWKLRLVAQEEGRSIEDILRCCVHRVVAEHRSAKAEIIKF